MSVWITGAGSKYIVPEEKLPRAYAWLEDRFMHVRARDIGGGLAEVRSDGDDEFFCGSTCYGFQDEAIEFIGEFCVPNSYACFRDDDNWEYGIVWKNDADEVHEEWVDAGNPFASRMEALDEALARKED